MIIRPGGLPGDCWQVNDTYSRCDEDSMPADPFEAPHWRQLAYERAVTRPCIDLPMWTLGGRRAKHCRASGPRGTNPRGGRVNASCGGTP